MLRDPPSPWCLSGSRNFAVAVPSAAVAASAAIALVVTAVVAVDHADSGCSKVPIVGNFLVVAAAAGTTTGKNFAAAAVAAEIAGQIVHHNFPSCRIHRRVYSHLGYKRT